LVIGFTGTRRGMSRAQRRFVQRELGALERFDEFHHGDCIGADVQAAVMVGQEFPATRIVVHPCNIARMRAHSVCTMAFEPLPPLQRNRNIVKACDYLLAVPGEEEEVLRSGTWSTIRYARKKAVSLCVVTPSGRHWREFLSLLLLSKPA